MIVTFTVEVGFPENRAVPNDDQIGDMLRDVVEALKNPVTSEQDGRGREHPTRWITEHHLVEAAVSEYTVPAHTVNLA